MKQELEDIREKYNQLTQSLSDPALISIPQQIKKISKERAELEPVVKKYEAYEKIIKGIRDSEEILADSTIDAELKELAEEELKELQEKEIPMMKGMYSWRLELVPAGMKLLFSRRIFSGCIPVFRKKWVGNRKS